MSMQTQAQVKASPTPKPSFTPVRTGLLQRKCACGGNPGVVGECEECRKNRLSLQRRAADQAAPSTVPPIVHEVLQSSGQPLDAATRAFMEPRFGHDFSNVRVHTDGRAGESARAVNALAYTVGRNVVFGMGQHQQGTMEGKKLLAHELTHVVQQGLSESVPVGISSSHTPHEREASSAASTILEGKNPSVNPKTAATLLQRQDDFKLKMPTFGARTQRQFSLFPPGQQPTLHLDVSALRAFFDLQGVSNLRVLGPPRMLPGANKPPASIFLEPPPGSGTVSPLPRGPIFLPIPRGGGGRPPNLLGPLPGTGTVSPSPRIPAADEPNKIVDLDFSVSIEEMSLAGYTLARLGFPLQTPAEQDVQRISQLQAIFSGKQVEDRPLGLNLLSTGINVLGATVGKQALERTHLDNVTFIVNPATRTYGISVQFLIP